LEKLFEEYPNQIAAVILEPMNIEYPHPDFLRNIKQITHKHNAVLIFDEMVTGFRFANGGAQEFFNIIPDIATFGKGVSNGFPLSVIAGKKEIMSLMEEVFFSFTYGGETLSLAASLATLNKLQEKNVIANLINKYHLQDVLSISGHPTWSFLSFKEIEKYNSFMIKTFYMQEMFKQGILVYGTHNITYAHSDEDIEKLIQATEETFRLLKEYMLKDTLKDKLECDPLEPLFKVR